MSLLNSVQEKPYDLCPSCKIWPRIVTRAALVESGLAAAGFVHRQAVFKSGGFGGCSRHIAVKLLGVRQSWRPKRAEATGELSWASFGRSGTIDAREVPQVTVPLAARRST